MKESIRNIFEQNQPAKKSGADLKALIMLRRGERSPVFEKILGSDGVVDSGPDRQRSGGADKNEIHRNAYCREHGSAKQGNKDCGKLQRCFRLADGFCGNNNALACGKLADAADEDFPRNDDECEHRHQEIAEAHDFKSAEHDECGGGEQFVRRRIHQFAEVGNKAACARNAPVQRVRNIGKQENHCCKNIFEQQRNAVQCADKPAFGQIEACDKERYHKHAKHCKLVWKVHFCFSVTVLRGGADFTA